ncbi:MAG: hypothetical protein FWD60_07460 [Candidatus Azobacteroides sp.]|nr:hypothetical protein [Candidatus Azobacteroides sp.]
MIRLRAAVWGIILLIGILPVYAQEKISFFEEHIDFELDSAYFNINGIYSFYNPTDTEINQRIIFPVAVEMTQVDSIDIINLNDLNRIQFQRLKKAFTFFINMPPLDTVDVNIFYKQKTAKENTYIITSTQSWKQPLKQAVYTLTTSLPMDEEKFSYPSTSKEIINGKILYRWEKTNFMPDKEFEMIVD